MLTGRRTERNSRDWTSAAILGVALMLFGLTIAQQLNSGIPDLVGKPAPPLVAKSPKGADLSVDALRGSVVLVDFWSLGCPPCVAQMPILDRLVQRFQPRGFRLLSVNIEPVEWPTVPAWLREQGLGIEPAFVGRDGALAYGVSRIPLLVLIGRDGIVARVFAGATSGAKLTAAIESLL